MQQEDRHCIVFSPAVRISKDGSARGLGEEEEQDSPAIARPLRSTASSPGPSGERQGVRPAAGGGGARSRGWRRVRCPQSRDVPAAAGERPATSGDRSAGVEVGAEGLEQTWSRRANGTESSLRIRVSVAEETGPAVGIGSGVESLAQPSWEFASDSAIRLKHEGGRRVGR